MSDLKNHIPIIKTLFNCRQDVYALRWEKDGKNGYMPAYKIDWNDFNNHKAKGGTFKDYTKKEYLCFNENAIINHINGKEAIGIYPLLEDNTSFFIAADFDENNWKDSIINLFKICQKSEIPSYIERSRSGNGGHLWIFFDEPIEAEFSRKLMFQLLKDAGIISHFDKEPSFDRLFPNQDFHKGKGLGNLIALPLQGKSMQDGNSSFLNPETFSPFENQFDAIGNFQKLTKDKFDKIYKSFFAENLTDVIASSFLPEKHGFVEIQISNQVLLYRKHLNKNVISFLTDNLNFLNSDYLVKKNMGKSTYQTEKYFRLIDESSDHILIPRGFVARLINFLRAQNIEFLITDKRKKLEIVEFESVIELLPHQKLAIEKTNEKDFGVIVSPPGSGKTIIGLEIIARKKQPALILVHRKQLFDQWIDRIQNFLKIPQKDIGQIGNQKFTIGKKITVAMIQSLVRLEESNNVYNSFGTIIIDECHHIPAKSFREAIKDFNTYYLYGLTATPKRKNNDEKLIYYHIGNILYNSNQDINSQNTNNHFEINIRETQLYAPFDYKIDNYETISRILIHDTQRNSLIIDDIINNAERFKTILVLTERKAHIDILNLYLKDKFEIVTIHGDDSDSARKSKLEQIKQGHFKIVISTGQFFGEGVDINSLECLFVVYPFAFHGKLIQYIGRIQRSGKVPVIFDYRDIKIDYFEKMFKQRNRYYKKLNS